jgi:hypothetical protein
LSLLTGVSHTCFKREGIEAARLGPPRGLRLSLEKYRCGPVGEIELVHGEERCRMAGVDPGGDASTA